MKLCLFNVKYSSNLGDGLLSECLEYAIRENKAVEECRSIDLAGRTFYGDSAPQPIPNLHYLGKLPAGLRRLLLGLPLWFFYLFKWKPHYRRQLKDSGFVVIGGGNLIADWDLNFPVKLAAALNAAAEKHLPVAIFACGVVDAWSPAGVFLLSRALSRARIVKIALRDKTSKAIWDAIFDRFVPIASEVVWDPGILTSRFLPASHPPHTGSAVGVCITSPTAVRYHSRFTHSDKQLLDWYIALISELIQSGHTVRAFTNGRPEDIQFLGRMLPHFQQASGSAFEHEQPAAPQELAKLISSCNALIAHRLHAIIPAYSYGIPFIALDWDQKLASFLQAVNLPHRLMKHVVSDPKEVVGRLFDAHDTAASKAKRAGRIEEASQQARDIADTIATSMHCGRELFINGRFLAQPMTGVQRFSREITLGMDRALKASGSHHKVTLVVPEGPWNMPHLSRIRVLRYGPNLGHAWEQIHLFRASRRGILVNLANSGPLLHSRQLTIIHDAAVYRMPDNYSYLYGAVHRFLGKALSHRSRIGTVSAFSRKELAHALSLKKEADIFSNGHEHLPCLERDEQIIDRLHLRERPFFLFVGSLAPNKNLRRAIEAFVLLKRSDVSFIIVGAAQKKVFQSLPCEIPANVVMPGRLSDGEIAALYHHAVALLFPSLYEGFGIPPLEAMAFNCPVVASRIAPIEEVCADAALYFDPLKPEEMAERMTEVLQSGAIRTALVAKGKMRLPLFSWQHSADKLLQAACSIQ